MLAEIAENFTVQLIYGNKVAIVTISRETKKNALTFDHFAGLERIMNHLESLDVDLRAVILTGKKNFCAGLDVGSVMPQI